MRNNQAFFKKELQMDLGLLEQCMKEFEMGIQEFNGENGKSLLKKMDKANHKPWMAAYNSTARNLYRGCWFFDFLTEIFRGFNEDKTVKLAKVATEAYNKALAPHHPWVLKKVAGVAMNAINYREVFIKNYCTQQAKLEGLETYPEEQMYEDTLFLSQQAEILSGHLWKFSKENGLDKLP